MNLNPWIQLLYTNHMDQTTATKLTGVAILRSVQLVGRAHTNTRAMTRLYAFPLQCYVIFLYLSIFSFYIIF